MVEPCLPSAGRGESASGLILVRSHHPLLRPGASVGKRCHLHLWSAGTSYLLCLHWRTFYFQSHMGACRQNHFHSASVPHHHPIKRRPGNNLFSLCVALYLGGSYLRCALLSCHL